MLYFYLSLLETEQDKKTFEKLYKSNKKRMFMIAYKYVHNNTEAEDVVQEVFFRIVSKPTKIFDIPEEKQEAYLNVMTKNIAIDFYNKKVGETSYDDNISKIDDIIDDNDIISFINKEDLIEFIKELPQGQKIALYTVCFLGLSYSEAAEQINISEPALRQRLCSARKAIAAYLEKEKQNGNKN